MSPDDKFIIRTGQRWIREGDERAWQVVRYRKTVGLVLLQFMTETMSIPESNFRKEFRRLRSSPPLRRVVGHEQQGFGTIVEVLECGHRLYPRGRLSGASTAKHRQCRACQRA